MTLAPRVPPAGLKRPKRTKKREPFVGWRLPKMVPGAAPGEWVRPFGPNQFVSKPARGRPALEMREVIMRLIDAEIAKRGADPASRCPKTDLAGSLSAQCAAKPERRHVEKVARWLRDPTRGQQPWPKS